jgi:hypothetical protein
VRRRQTPSSGRMSQGQDILAQRSQSARHPLRDSHLPFAALPGKASLSLDYKVQGRQDTKGRGPFSGICFIDALGATPPGPCRCFGASSACKLSSPLAWGPSIVEYRLVPYTPTAGYIGAQKQYLPDDSALGTRTFLLSPNRLRKSQRNAS